MSAEIIPTGGIFTSVTPCAEGSREIRKSNALIGKSIFPHNDIKKRASIQAVRSVKTNFAVSLRLRTNLALFICVVF